MLYRRPMGSIIGRTPKDGTTTYLAQILLKSKGKIVRRESQTFDRKQSGKAWLARRRSPSPTALTEAKISSSPTSLIVTVESPKVGELCGFCSYSLFP